MWRTGKVVRGIPAIHHPPMAVHQYNRNGIVPAQLLYAVQHSKDTEEGEYSTLHTSRWPSCALDTYHTYMHTPNTTEITYLSQMC